MHVISQSQIDAAQKYFSIIADEEDGRWRSWDLCHDAFRKLLKNSASKDDIDRMALVLAFYLASWGMYRSSFLLQKDYTVHTEAVAILVKYPELLDLNCESLANDQFRSKISVLADELRDCYQKVADDTPHRDVYGEKIDGARRRWATDLLVTKVMLGTLACSPAYDRFFTEGEKILGVTPRGFGEGSMKQLAALCKDNEAALRGLSDSFSKAAMRVRPGVNEGGYPDMKVLDFLIWHIGLVGQK